ncbi:MAG: hypothetical protein KDC48_04125 [Planctomycetes bacterium]|nr:hypothetical protein [Planctomycetota bacterium]
MRSKILLSVAPAVLALALPAQPGTVIGTITAPDVPYGLGTGLNGELFMVSQSRVLYELSLTGSIVRQFSIATDTGAANGVCFDGTNFYVTDSSTTTRGIDVYDAMGNYQRTIAVPGTFPSGICYNPTNAHLYTSDRVAGSAITEYDLAGNQLGTITANGTAVAGVTYEPASNEYWTLDAIGDTLDGYDSMWSPITSFPGPLASASGRGRSCVSIARALYVAIPGTSQIAIFDTTGTLAALETVGTSCPQPGVFYELFTGTGTGDLTGLTYRFNSASGTGCNASASGRFITNLGTNLNLGDDTEATVTLSSALPYPGGSTSSLVVCSNGFISVASGNGTSYQPLGTALLARPHASWNVWRDFICNATGNVWFEEIGGVAYITWNGVIGYVGTTAGTVTSTFQLQFELATGHVDFVFGSMDTVSVSTWAGGEGYLVGFSPSGASLDPGSVDLSAVLPTSIVLPGNDIAPLALNASARPLVTTTINFDTTNIPAGTPFGAVLLGFTQFNPGIDLTGIGMSGCRQYNEGAATLLFLPGGNTSNSLAFTVPNYIGYQIEAQSVVYAPAAGLTQLGAIASNGLALFLGNL